MLSRNHFLFVIHNPKYTRRNKGQQEKDADDAVIKASLEVVTILRLLEQRKKVILHVKMNIYTHISSFQSSSLTYKSRQKQKSHSSHQRQASLLGRQKIIKTVTAGDPSLHSVPISWPDTNNAMYLVHTLKVWICAAGWWKTDNPKTEYFYKRDILAQHCIK